MKTFKELKSEIKELNGQTGPVLRIAYKPQRAGGKLTSHSTIVKSDLYRDVYYNKKNWQLTANTNSIEMRLPHAKGNENDRKDFMGLLKSAKGDVSNLIRGGGFTRSEVQELKRDYEKAAKAFGATKVVSQDHSIYVSHDVPGKLKVKAGLLAMLKALDEFGMRNHISLSSRDGVLTQIQDAGQYDYNESVNESVQIQEGMSKQMPIEKYAKKIGINKKEQQWILDNEADMIVFEPNQNKANSFMVLSYPVNDGDYYFAFLTGKSTDPQDKMRDLASKENAKMNKYLKALVKKNSPSMGDSNLSGFVWTEMMKQFDKLPRQLGAGDTMTREELAAAIEDAVRAPIIWEGTDTSNKPQIAEGILDKIMDKIRKAKKKIKKIKLGRKAKTNMESKDIKEDKEQIKKQIDQARAKVAQLQRFKQNATNRNQARKMQQKIWDAQDKLEKLRDKYERAAESKEVKEFKDPTKNFPRDREWKQLVRKHKRHIKALQDRGKDLPSDAEEDFVSWGMDNGEIKNSDDIERFIEDELLNASYVPEGEMNLKELRRKNAIISEKYRSKFKSKDIAKAVEIAHSMGGNMTGAYKKIEKMKKGLGDDPMVAAALRVANESKDNQ